jgi:hypothetical protein
MSSSILLNVLDIYLDTENPRHDPIHEQEKVILHLLDGEKVKSLAKHISIHGVNPLDSVGVVKDEEDNYVVVEGNRRLCALLLLNDPDKAPSSDVLYFRKLSEGSSNVPSSVNCVLFDDSNEANIWMGIRHNGEQDGVGIRSWDSKQKTRHNGKINKKDHKALSLALIDYAVQKEILISEKTDRIITTAARYLGNPFIRETFGIVSSRSEQEVKINVSCEDFNIVMTRFCSDLVSNTVVNSRTRKENWIDYARKLIEEGIAPKLRVSPYLLSDCVNSSVVNQEEQDFKYQPEQISNVERNSSDVEIGSSEVDNSERVNDVSQADNGSQRGNKNPDIRKYILPEGFRPVINNRILRRVFEEMKTIEVDVKTLSVALITRAFLENLYILFHEKVTGSYQTQPTHILIGKVIKEIELDSTLTKVEKNAIAALKRVQSNELNVLSPKTLGANAHAGIYPNSTELKREFDNISAVVLYMLRRC